MVLESVRKLFLDSVKMALELYVIVIPMVILVKILKEFGMIDVLGNLLMPVMGLVGLPGGMGLVWATSAVNGIYSSMVVFVYICADHPLTIAQTTVIGGMMLIAHSLPVEVRIAQKAGVRALATTVLRVGGSFLFGWILFHVYGWGNWFQEVNIISWIPPANDPSLISWTIDQFKLLAFMYAILLILLTLVRFLTWIGITSIITRLLNPVLRLLGIGKAASTITIIGMTLGISYGGALIIGEATSNRLDKKDIFFSLSLMGLTHSLIEDTFLVIMLGSSLSGVFWGRIIFTLVLVFILVRVVSHLSDETFTRYFYRPARIDPGTPPEASA